MKFSNVEDYAIVMGEGAMRVLKWSHNFNMAIKLLVQPILVRLLPNCLKRYQTQYSILE